MCVYHRSGNTTSNSTANSEADANAKHMEEIAKAVATIQAFIEKKASLFSLHTKYEITDVEERLNRFDQRLSSLELSQALVAKENCAVREKVTHLDNYTRRQNICIMRIKENTEGERFQKSPSVHRAHRSSAPKDDNKSRPFILKLHHFQNKDLILLLTTMA